MIKQEFLQRIKLKHPNNFKKYDYSLVPNEFKSKDKVKIICNIHGIFEQKYNNHLFGYGCIKCQYDNNKQLSTFNNEIFIKRAKDKHGTKYNYSKVNYVNSNTKITITCPIHGDFLQRPNKHLQGRGCPKCSESKGEKYISQILDNLNIKYIREYKISGYNYRYDFYLPEYNIYIEYHGKQHYKKEEFFGGIKGFNKIKRRDKTKIELVKRSSGLLIILDYKLNTIELIRNELLRIFNLLHPKFLIDKDFTKDYIDNSKVYLYNNGIMHIRK